MSSSRGKSLMRLTASCEIAVRNVGLAGGNVVLEIKQGKAGGGDVTTTLLLYPDTARELASVLLGHSGREQTQDTEEDSDRLPEDAFASAAT